MKKNILVSICCITYNQENYIRDALDSFLMQKTNFNYEIIIHDDASTDNTALIIKEYEKKYPKIIRPIYQKENQYSKGRNVLLNVFKKAIGRYIAICEGDDYWLDSYKLQKQFDYMEKNKDCGLCFHGVEILEDKTKRIIGEIKAASENRIISTSEIILGGGSFIGTNSIFSKREILQNLPEFFEKSPVGDYPLQIITSTKDYAYFINENMSIYRTNVENSWTSQELKPEKEIEIKQGLITMLKMFDEYSFYKYTESIKRKIKEYQIEILIYKNDVKKLKKYYKEIYDLFSRKRKIRLYIQYYFPSLQNRILKLIRIYRKLNLYLGRYH